MSSRHRGEADRSQRRDVRTHEDLLAAAATLAEAIKADPVLGTLLMIDPVRAMSETGLVLSPDMQAHVEKTVFSSVDRRPASSTYDRVRNGTSSIPWVGGLKIDLHSRKSRPSGSRGPGTKGAER
jgi:hypothetical protein